MDTIAETIKFAGFGKKKAMAKQIQMFDDRFTDQGETLLAVCASVKGVKQLYVTDQRVLLHEIKGLVSNDEKAFLYLQLAVLTFLISLFTQQSKSYLLETRQSLTMCQRILHLK